MNKILIRGARENNLKNINIDIPKNKLVVMTGVSGSGKSSLAFDTIYAESQRRYVESLSAYARQFLGNMEKPDVDSIEGLSPGISIDQKSTNKNPRSTVGTVTEIYDYLRLLFARIGIPYCPIHKKPIKSQSIEEMTNKVLTFPIDTKIEIIAPVIRGEKGTHKEEIEELKRNGYTRLRVNGKEIDLNEEDVVLEKNIKDNIDVIIDRVKINEKNRSRIFEDIELSTKIAKSKVLINIPNKEEILMSENYACPLCNFSIEALEPRMFSFNSPFGACPECKGLGKKLKIDEDLLIPDKTKSIVNGAIISFQNGIKLMSYYKKLKEVSKFYNIDLNKPVNKLKRKELDIILYGSKDKIKFEFISKNGSVIKSNDYFEGIITNLERRYVETTSESIRFWIEKYMSESNCEVCNGARLQEKILNVKINDKNIYEVSNMSISELRNFILNLKLNKEQKSIAQLIVKEINDRLLFLENVGLDYLTLSRSASTLSGGEMQRIRLATQIGSRLSGVIYVLDEPSIGLHQKDNIKLINSLKEMRDIGNTLIVVEHDTEMMLNSDYLIDMGPEAGEKGGYIVSKGTPKEVMNDKNSLTGKYLKGELKIMIPLNRRKSKKYITIEGAKENNLKNITVKIPLGVFTCVTGVSGSGKSTLIDEILYKNLANKLYGNRTKPGKFKSMKGLNNIDKVVYISQDPIGRTPRSNPATYVGVFDEIRKVFANTKEAKLRGYTASRFSFNVKGGRCEACTGDGVKKIEMHFLPDVYVPCDICGGKRYNKETLQVKFKGLSISDVLNLRVDEALEIFKNIPKVYKGLKIMHDVGLGYIFLGQNALTLSGGEASRVKLAKELQKKPTGKSVFILDEPSTGLHTHDIKKLLTILNTIVEHKDTVIVIEHNLDIISFADYIIDLGPEGGEKGGLVVATGTPEEVAKNKNSYTGLYLKNILKKENRI